MERSAKIWMVVAIVLFVVILVLTWLLFALPTPRTELVATSSPQVPAKQPAAQTPSTDQPLSARVSVTSPLPNTTVGKTFVVKGSAPGNWFFEATFPMQVRDKDGNVIARTHANAQGEWMTTELVAFVSTINIDGAYTGPATLVLMRDNPSGLPEHDDAVEIPIVIE